MSTLSVRSPEGKLLIVREFRGDFSWLSNFDNRPVLWYSQMWPTREHLYQAAKTNVPAEKEAIRKAATPGIAKKMGRSVTLRPDWEGIKIPVMERIQWESVMQHQDLAELLLRTDEALLQEGNWWGDEFWGVNLKNDPPTGQNWVGRLWMWTRAKLQHQQALHEFAQDLQMSSCGLRWNVTLTTLVMNDNTS